MRALRLDYQRSGQPVSRLGFGVLGTALLALAVLAGHYHELGRDIAAWEARVDQGERLSGQRGQAQRPASGQAAREQALEVQHANQVLRQLSLPWGTLFRAVESAGGKSVALLSMQPDIAKGTVTIGGEAKDFDALLDYLRRLGAGDVFVSVHLQNHQVQQQDPERPVRFSLLAVWKAGAP
jgi:Tfp pilus assembly protein PilN